MSKAHILKVTPAILFGRSVCVKTHMTGLPMMSKVSTPVHHHKGLWGGTREISADENTKKFNSTAHLIDDVSCR